MENLETVQNDVLESSSEINEINENIKTVEENEVNSDVVSFEDLGLDEYTLKAVERKGFVTPSPIQLLAIPNIITIYIFSFYLNLFCNLKNIG